MRLPAEEVEHLRHAYRVLRGEEHATEETRLTLGALWGNCAEKYRLPPLAG
jgi:hypothetical protein